MIIDRANLMPVLSPRELAWFITDTEGYYIIYRILKAAGLITSPAFNIITASDKFKHPTSRVNELWQIDFTYFKVMQWGWQFLASVLDDYSRYIVYWKLYS
jgi:transposase InsO family protein